MRSTVANMSREIDDDPVDRDPPDRCVMFSAFLSNALRVVTSPAHYENKIVSHGRI